MLKRLSVITGVTSSVAVLLLAGCEQQERTNVKSPEASPPAASLRYKGGGPHVSLSPNDLTLELEKHCNSAKECLRTATSLASADSISGRRLSDLKAELVKADKEMTECTLMVHGVYEQQIGEPQSERK